MYSEYQLVDFLNLDVDTVNLKEMYWRLNTLVFDGELGEDCQLPVLWNKRMYRTAGRLISYSRTWGVFSKTIISPDRIEISYKYHSKYPNLLLCTMVHEMAHVLCPGTGHREDWFKLINRLNDELPILKLTQNTTLDYWKYIYSCDCRTFKEATKLGVDKYKCTRCNSYLKLTETCSHA